MAEPVMLYAVERGSGLPVLLLHGFPFDHTIWDAQITDLSADYRVIAPDLRGYGRSPVTAGTYTMDLLARDVIALLDRLGIERAVWVGHSMGGYLTMAALRLAPERFLGVGLVATQPYADSQEKRVQRLQSAARALEDGVGSLADNMLGVLFAPGVDPQSALVRRVDSLMRSTAPEGAAGAQRGMAERPDSCDTLRGLAVPAAVIAGDADQLVALDTARAMAALIPPVVMLSERFVVIHGAGHMPMLEQPAITGAALRDLMRACSAG